MPAGIKELLGTSALFWGTLLSLSVTLGHTWQIEHLFVDDPRLDAESTDIISGGSEGAVADPTPMLFKCVGPCDRQGVTSGTKIEISGCKWPSVNNRVFILEATSGWFFVLEEAQPSSSASAPPRNNSLGDDLRVCGVSGEKRLRAVRPTEEEYQKIFDKNEKGYLTKRNAGSFRVLPESSIESEDEK